MGDSDGGAKGGGVHFWLQGRLERGIVGGIRVLSLRLGSLCRVWAGGGGGFPGVGCRIVFRRGLLCFVLGFFLCFLRLLIVMAACARYIVPLPSPILAHWG